jgi:hypothetical protein
MSDYTTEPFKSLTRWIMSKLISDFGISAEAAAAVCGNLAYETGGFKHYQEIKPVVHGSRGGAGWAQWTGPRRRAFESFCVKRGLGLKSKEGNYAFLWFELKGTEKAAMDALRRQDQNRASLLLMTETFEKKFERAGVKNYAARHKYALRCLDAFHGVKPEVEETVDSTGGDTIVSLLIKLIKRILKWN